MDDRDEKGLFLFGPDSTSASIMAMAERWRHDREKEDAAWRARRRAAEDAKKGVKSSL